MNILVFNPGGNSLKVEIVSCSESQRHAAEGRKLASVGIEGIGKSARVLVFEGKKVVRTGSIDAANYTEAADPSSSANGSTGGKDDLASQAEPPDPGQLHHRGLHLILSSVRSGGKL